MYKITTREELAKLFLPKNQDQLDKLSLSELEMIEKKLLNCEILKKFPCCYKGERTNDDCRYDKFYEFFSVNSRYHAAFELCELLGVKEIYDIGCGFLNQSFLLLEKHNISYTGIDTNFWLLDCRNVIDESYPNYHCPVVFHDLPEFCNGRIRFVNHEYPYTITPKHGNIAIAFHSLGFRLSDEENVTDEIRAILKQLEHDFERILITIGSPVPLTINGTYEYLPVWKKLMPDFHFFKVEHSEMRSLVFATKVSEDIQKIRSAKWFPIHRYRMYTMEHNEIKTDYDFSIDQFYEAFPYEKFRHTSNF